MIDTNRSQRKKYLFFFLTFSFGRGGEVTRGGQVTRNVVKCNKCASLSLTTHIQGCHFSTTILIGVIYDKLLSLGVPVLKKIKAMLGHSQIRKWPNPQKNWLILPFKRPNGNTD